MILWIILGVIALLILICVIRAAKSKGAETFSEAHLEKHSDKSKAYAKELQRLIQIETISVSGETDHTKFYTFHKEMETMFPNIHRVCEKFDLDGSLLFRWKGKGDGQPVMLMNHMDVVEANGEWRANPFGGEIIDGRIFGRGALDDKGPLYVMYRGIEELIGEDFVPPCDVYLASTCTEETNGQGAQDIVRWLQKRGIVFRFLLDEGGAVADRPIAGLPGAYATVGVLEKGNGNVKFIARGQGGHASSPPKNSPLVRLGMFMNDIEKHNPFKVQVSPTLLEMVRNFNPYLPFSFRLLTANLWLFKPLIKVAARQVPMLAAMTRTTVAFTTAKGAEGYNVLPTEAYVTANLRYSPHQGVTKSHAILERIAQKYDLEMEVINAKEPSPVVDYNGEAFRMVAASISHAYPGVCVTPYIMTGATDSRFYSEVSPNSIRFAPLFINAEQLAAVHSVDENIYVNTLASGVAFYKDLMKRI